VPIVPCSIVGAEEIYPIVGNMKTLARLLGPALRAGHADLPAARARWLIPLPSKWIIEFGEPIPTDGYGLGAADDPMLVFNLTDQVRETIQHTLYRLLMSRARSSSSLAAVSPPSRGRRRYGERRGRRRVGLGRG
jgi:1-acyl-sn-glycerol-3-phosphate acyltransferase